MIRVIVVDDQALIRAAVAELLRAEDDIEVVGVAVNGAEALTMVRESTPDVVLMDIRMPVMDGITATRAIREDDRLSAVRVLILTTFEEDENLLASLRAGASGFIGKGAEPEEIGRAVRAVHAGNALLSPTATRSLIDRFLDGGSPPAAAPANDSRLATLTERERETLVLVGQGLSNDAIASSLVISPHTAKTHVNRIMSKLDLHDRVQLVILAYQTGLVPRGSGF